jgi:hypothetical protein
VRKTKRTVAGPLAEVVPLPRGRWRRANDADEYVVDGTVVARVRRTVGYVWELATPTLQLKDLTEDAEAARSQVERVVTTFLPSRGRR